MATRDRLRRTRTAEFDNASLDEVIVRLLDSFADQRLRERLRADAELARGDASDLAEVRRVQAELDELSAW